jgi:dihydroorotate dehydrogenase (NAD+) catalytic subunit
MAVDIETRRPKLGNVTGGLGSGHPPGRREARLGGGEGGEDPGHRHGRHPGCGGRAGVHHRRRAAVAVGTANFVEPGTAAGVIDGIRGYLERHGLDSVDALRGTIRI